MRVIRGAAVGWIVATGLLAPVAASAQLEIAPRIGMFNPVGSLVDEGTLNEKHQGAAILLSEQRAGLFRQQSRFDPAHRVSRIDKPRRYWFGISHLPREWIVHSPTIAHFIGLKPNRAYRETATFFERNLTPGI